MNLGVFGGSFDPPHYGHLIMAQEAQSRLGLDLVLFVPAGLQPLKQGLAASSIEDRVAMTELAIADNPVFRLSRTDADHPGPSYTVDTLARLQQEWGPNTSLSFIVGADSLASLLAWRDPEGILERARLVAVERPGFTPNMGVLNAALPTLARRLDRVQAPLISISATELRARVANGLPIRYWLPPAVEDYIKQRGLYMNSI